MMDIYNFLREVAGSWSLILMFAFFVGMILWIMRPGSKEIHQDTADIPFRHEDKPAQDSGMQTKEARS